MPGWPNYVALGDSLTAGRDDYGTEGGRIGWARRLAAILGTRTGVPCSLTNVDVVLEWQLPVAARLGPDLVSVTVGVNDIRDPGFGADRFAAGVGRVLDGLTVTGATILTCTLPDIAGIMSLPEDLVGPARQLMRQASDIIRDQAAAHGALCLDIWATPTAADPRLFGSDRIHPNASGHQLLAAACADLLLAG